jgi:hypothetical protein
MEWFGLFVQQNRRSIEPTEPIGMHFGDSIGGKAYHRQLPDSRIEDC